MNNEQQQHGGHLGRGTILRVFLPFALGYFLSYIFRTVNSVIGPDLAADVGLSADQLGLLTAAYFLAFALFQLPLGMLLDRFGPRRVQIVLVLITAAGTALFAAGQSALDLALGRALIGLGVSGAMMAAFKAFVQWFPRQRLPMANALFLALGGTGALVATLPAELFLAVYGWRELFWGLAAFGVLVALVIGTVAPEHPEPPAHASLQAQLRGLAQVLRAPHFWAIAPLTMLTQAAYLAFQGLWAGPWLRDVGGLPREQAASGLFVLAAAVVTGFAASGAITDWFTRRGARAASVAAAGMSIFMGVELLMILLPGDWAMWCLPVFGLFAASGTVCYAALSQSFPAQLAGRANTALNLLVFLCAFLLQWGIGAVLSFWEAPLSQHYQAAGYDWALSGILLLQLAALLWFLRPLPAEQK